MGLAKENRVAQRTGLFRIRHQHFSLVSHLLKISNLVSISKDPRQCITSSGCLDLASAVICVVLLLSLVSCTPDNFPLSQMLLTV